MSLPPYQAFLPYLIQVTDSNSPGSQPWIEDFPLRKYLKVRSWEWCKQRIPWSFKSPQVYYLSILWDNLCYIEGTCVILETTDSTHSSCKPHTMSFKIASPDTESEAPKLSMCVFVFLITKQKWKWADTGLSRCHLPNWVCNLIAACTFISVYGGFGAMLPP